ncbi:hypothetical protein J5X98_06620 [Leptothermofonsia sichuanensis E412]|nr:hypothetical protein [Leptothermofonsia sichuanensis]QZZ22069.1 hypothetical protein J5X98_06620 [Leptothermofonsia sichuanensis E412]
MGIPLFMEMGIVCWLESRSPLPPVTFQPSAESRALLNLGIKKVLDA